MLRPVSLLPALVALAATVLGGATVPAGAQASAQASARATAPADPEAPLAVTLVEMTPSVVPERGRITLRGSVTNVDDETWTSIEMYPFVSDEPLTTRGEIAAAAAVPATDTVGRRVTAEGPYATIEELAPGQTVTYTVRVRSQDLETDAPGVYWFGVHALGESPSNPEGPVPTADGRARTFLPRLNRVDDPDRTVKTALVLPVRAAIAHDADGSLADPTGWATNLSGDGRLGALVEAGAAAGDRALTWLVDPAVADAAVRLQAGNPARSLAPTLDPDATEDPDAALADPDDPAASPSPAPGTALPATPEPPAAEGGEDDGSGEEARAGAEEPTADEQAAARAATAWLDRFGNALGGAAEVLALPYGDLDLPAAVKHDATAYTRARQRSGDALQPWGVATSPGIGTPRGYLDLTSIQAAAEGETLIGSDLMLSGLRNRVPTVVSVDGRRVVLASTAAASGGPGPDDPDAGVAMRQRILAEAAVRRLTTRREPLVVTLPADFAPEDPAGFFAGLDQPWLDLTTVKDVADQAATPVAAEDLVYPRFQARRELDAVDFDAARRLGDAGTALQYLLTRNDTVAAEVADEAASSLSYAHRPDPAAARAANDASRTRIEGSLRGVRISGPSRVTLSSASGRFSATLENTLDQPVTVRVRALADPQDPITITMAEEDVRLPAESRRSVLFNATTERQGIHNITLEVTDMAGTPLGTSDGVDIRAAQVSDVIWLIIGTGAALLFGAITVRLVRRVRTSRRTPEGDAEPTDADDRAVEQTPAPA
jgi:hypothetical protein